MTASGQEKFLLFTLIKQEIQTYIVTLRETITSIQKQTKVSEFLVLIIKSTENLLHMIQETPLDSLRQLLQVLNHYFNALKQGIVLTSEHLEILSRIIGEMAQLAHVDTVNLENKLKDQKANFNYLALEIEKFVHVSEIQSWPNLQEIEPNVSKILPLPLLDVTFQEKLTILFHKFSEQVQETHKNIEVFLSDFKQTAHLNSFIYAAQTLVSIGQVSQDQALIDMGEVATRYLINVQKDKFAEKMLVKEIIFQILEFFYKLSLISVEQLHLFLQEQQNDLKNIIQTLYQQFQKVPENRKSEDKTLKKSLELSEVVIDPSMFQLFMIEVETQCAFLNQGLMELEEHPTEKKSLQNLMRAAHSIKGAARIINLNSIVYLSHAIEDCFAALQNQSIEIETAAIDQLLQCVDFLLYLTKIDLNEVYIWLQEQDFYIQSLVNRISQTIKKSTSNIEQEIPKAVIKNHSLGSPDKPSVIIRSKHSETIKAFQTTFSQDRILRVTAQSLNRLMGLAGESLVNSRWLYPFGESLQKLKRYYYHMANTLDLLRDSLENEQLNETAQHCLTDAQSQLNEVCHQLNEHLNELDNFIRRHASVSDKLYQEVINSRMRPFSDGVQAFPRMVRDLAQQLGKKVKFEIFGKSTPVDRDILEKLETPLTHLLRNAVDHGIESPQERRKLGKSEEGHIKLEARHRGGMLVINISDDGRGIDLEQLRQKVVEKKFMNSEMAKNLTQNELIDFLFLPGFTTVDQITEISGRGVGLNIVQNMIQEVRGVVRTIFKKGKGMNFDLQLPLTLSVIHALLVEISGEIYAFPLARLEKIFLINRDTIVSIGNRQFFHDEGQNIGLIPTWQVLEVEEPELMLKILPVIVVSDRLNSYGLVVDRLIGEKELVVQELDSRLGKLSDISAGALMEDGSPVLIIDIEDIIRSIDQLLLGGHLTNTIFEK